MIETVQINTDAFAAYWRFRKQLWPMSDDQCLREAADTVANPRWTVFAARLDGQVVGFLEVSLRDYAEGAESSPVGFLEGLYVQEEYRKRGIARALVRAGEQWAWSRGCAEMG